MKRIGLACPAMGDIVALSAVGCSDDTATDATEPIEADGDGTTAAAAGDGEGGGAGGEGVGDLAIPLPPSADAVIGSESGPATIVQFIVPLDERDPEPGTAKNIIAVLSPLDVDGLVAVTPTTGVVE